MRTFSALYHIAKADFLERTRRYSFLITLGLTIYASYLFVPPYDAGYVTMRMGNYRGVYTSAWIGTMVALLSTTFLTLVGFYIVKNSIERDYRTGVGQIISTGPVKKVSYILGKTTSNFAVLAVMAIITAVSAVVMYFMRGENAIIDLWALISPFLFVTLPAVALVSAIAVLFESIPWLRGSLGNIAYFFLWGYILVIAIDSYLGGNLSTHVYDAFGITVPIDSILSTLKEAYPGFDGKGFSMGMTSVSGHMPEIRWYGVDWTVQNVAERLLWVTIAIIIAIVSSFFFRGFDRNKEKVSQYNDNQASTVPAEIIANDAYSVHSYSKDLSPVSLNFSFINLVQSELKIMLKGLNLWWYLIISGLNIACIVAPFTTVRQYLLPITWAFPIAIWSAMGTRESIFNTEQLVFSNSYIVRRQLPALMLAGVLVTMLTGTGAGVNYLLAGSFSAFLSWLSGSLFVPALALCMGVWCKSRKIFEVIYILLLYVGPLNKSPFFDFTGATDKPWAMGMPVIFTLTALVLFSLAAIGRRVHINR